MSSAHTVCLGHPRNRAYYVFVLLALLSSCVFSGICHGVAGSGYALLMMHRLTGEEVYHTQAIAYAEFLESEEFVAGSRTPDCPYSLYEGQAGTACFLADLAQPARAAFPFMDPLM